MLSCFPVCMDETMNNLENACPICGASDNEPDARYCESCGSKIGTALIKPIPPPNPCELGKVIAERFTVTSLLWTAPTYNAYSAIAQDSPGAEYTIIERRLTNGDPLAGLSPVGPEQTSAQSRVSGSLEEAAAAFERFGLYQAGRARGRRRNQLHSIRADSRAGHRAHGSDR